jgi:aminopeptidase N
VLPAAAVPLSTPILSRVPEILAWLEDRLGAYPFDTFGLLTYAGDPTTAILEAQTLVLIPDRIFDPRLAICDVLAAIAHEATHQWFGDDVSLVSWDEKWLSEGHATLYEWSWRAANICDDGGLEARMHDAYTAAQATRDAGGPPARPNSPEHAYDDTIYGQGALALYALQQKVGVDVFAAIERTFLERFSGGNASTADFIAVASEVAGRDLGAFLDAWLYGADVPAMPGHPDWVVAPAPSPALPAPSPALPAPSPRAPRPPARRGPR